MAQERTANKLVTLWETKRDDMMTGELPTDLMETLVKAARVGRKDAIKFLGFKGLSRGGKKTLDILAEPCDPYQPGAQSGGQRGADKSRSSW